MIIPVHPKARHNTGSPQRKYPLKRPRCMKHIPSGSCEQRACSACAVLHIAKFAKEMEDVESKGFFVARALARDTIIRTYRCAMCIWDLAENELLLNDLVAIIHRIEGGDATAATELKQKLRGQFGTSTKCTKRLHIMYRNGGRCDCNYMCKCQAPVCRCKLWGECKEKWCMVAHPFAGLGF